MIIFSCKSSVHRESVGLLRRNETLCLCHMMQNRRVRFLYTLLEKSRPRPGLSSDADANSCAGTTFVPFFFFPSFPSAALPPWSHRALRFQGDAVWNIDAHNTTQHSAANSSNVRLLPQSSQHHRLLITDLVCAQQPHLLCVVPF